MYFIVLQWFFCWKGVCHEIFDPNFSPINWAIDRQIEIFSISPRFSNIKLEQILTPRFLHCAGQRGVNTLDCLINFLKRVYFHQCLPLKRFYVRCPDHSENDLCLHGGWLQCTALCITLIIFFSYSNNLAKSKPDPKRISACFTKPIVGWIKNMDGMAGCRILGQSMMSYRNGVHTVNIF